MKLVVIKSAVFAFLTTLLLSHSGQVYAVTAVCGPVGEDAVAFQASPDPWETYWFVLDGQADLSGASHGSQYAPYDSYWPLTLYYYNIQPGTSVLNGNTTIQYYTGGEGGGGPYYGANSCSYEIEVEGYCDSTEPYNQDTTTIKNEFGTSITDSLEGGLGSTLVGCSVSDTPTVTGSVEVETFDQCCEAEQEVLSSTTASGSLSVDFPVVECNSPPFYAWGIQVQAGVSTSLNASASYSGQENVCGEQEDPVEFSGSAGGNLGASVSLSAPFTDPNILGIVGSGDGPFSVGFDGPDPFDLSFNGCYGPVTVGLTINYVVGASKSDDYEVSEEQCYP